MSEPPRKISLPQHQQSQPTTSAHPELINCADEIGVQADPELTAAGWERRHLVDPERARESIELYESLGFEVLARKLTPEDFSTDCRECASVICQTYVLIHTRKKKKS